MIDLPFFSPSARQLVGLDISSSSVKLVELSAGEKDAYSGALCGRDLPRDAVVDGNIANLDAVRLRRALRRFGSGVRNVALALPSSPVSPRRSFSPEGLRETEMEFAVEAEANQYIPFVRGRSISTSRGSAPAPGSPGDVEVLIAASRKGQGGDRVAVAQAAGLKAVIVDVESLATESALELVWQLPRGGADRGDRAGRHRRLGHERDDVPQRLPIYSREHSGGGQLTGDIARQYGMSFEEAELPSAPARCPTATRAT